MIELYLSFFNYLIPRLEKLIWSVHPSQKRKWFNLHLLACSTRSEIKTQGKAIGTHLDVLIKIYDELSKTDNDVLVS